MRRPRFTNLAATDNAPGELTDPLSWYRAHLDGTVDVRPLSAAGIDDGFNINSAYNWGYKANLASGVFKIQTPIVLDNNALAFRGAGMNLTTISANGGESIEGMLVIGNTKVVQNISVGGFQLFGNANSGHNILWRAGLSNLRDVTSQNSAGDTFRTDASSISASSFIDQCVIENLQGIGPAGNGFYSDGHLVSSDIYGSAFDGQPDGSSAPGGNIGINVTGGNNLRFHGTHAYLFANGGASISGHQHVLDTGELESNGVADLIFTAATQCVAKAVSFYDFANPNPPSQHIQIENASTKIDIADCLNYPSVYTVPNFYSIASGCQANIHDCPGFNPVGLLTAPAYASGTMLTNPFPHAVRVFVTGTSAVAIDGTATGLASGTFDLESGETITPTGTGGSWTWFGK